MMYRVIDLRYMMQYGVEKALRFSRKFEELKDALYFIYNQSNWYDLRIIAESEDH